MQIFVRNIHGKSISVNVGSDESIGNIMRKFKEKEGIRSDLDLRFVYASKRLEDYRTLADYNILEESTLKLVLSQKMFIETWNIRVRTGNRMFFCLQVSNPDTVNSVKARIREALGTPVHKQLLSFRNKMLVDGSRSLAYYGIRKESTLDLAVQSQRDTNMNSEGPQSATIEGSLTSEGQHNLRNHHAPQAALRENKRSRLETQITPIAQLIPALMPVQAPPENPSMHSARQVASQQTNIAEPTRHSVSIFNTSDGEVCAEYIQGLATSADRQAMSHNNYDDKLKLFALHQAKATAALSNLMQEFRSPLPSSVLTELEDLKREMAKAHTKEKELLATISELTHKNKVITSQCASYENQVVALEVENKKTKEELTIAETKYCPEARAAGYAEGLKEGKTKWLKSVEFLQHVTDASLQYFNYGFDSCQKQAEQQGFVGQLNKDAALKNAPF